MDIRERLFALQDEKFREGQKKIIKETQLETIGVRTPALRELAKELYAVWTKKPEDGTKAVQALEVEAFLQELPHRYFDEYQLHSFIISLDNSPRCSLS